jgi:hypothetical protein
MEQFVIELKDLSKRTFLLELLAQFDFIELKTGKEAKSELKKDDEYDLFESAGLFANREIDANQLRKEAWRVQN